MWYKLHHGHYVKVSYSKQCGHVTDLKLILHDFSNYSGTERYCAEDWAFKDHKDLIKKLVAVRGDNDDGSEVIDEINHALSNLDELYMYEEVSPLHVDFYPESETLYYGRYFRVLLINDPLTSKISYQLSTWLDGEMKTYNTSSSLKSIQVTLSNLGVTSDDEEVEFEEVLDEINIQIELPESDSKLTPKEAAMRMENVAEKRPQCYGCHPKKDSRSSRCLICEHEHDCINSTRKLESTKAQRSEDHTKANKPTNQSNNSTGNRKENKFMKQMENLFKDFYPSEVPSGEVAMTMYGQMAVKRKDGSYVRYNATTGQIENQMNLVVSSEKLDKMYILMPTVLQQLQVGDIIKEKETYYQIIELAAQANKIKTVNLSTSAESSIKIESNIITGQKMYRKVFSFFGMAQQNQGANPMMQQGMFNPMMLMMLDSAGDSADDSIRMMAMMSMMPQMMGSQTGTISPLMNPMMMYFMMGDSSNSDGNDWIKMMAMSSMMQQFGAVQNFSMPSANPMMTPQNPAEVTGGDGTEGGDD